MSRSPLRLLIVLLALVGLVSQTAAYAMAPLATKAIASIEVAASSSDCAGIGAPEGDLPCDGITLDCIADMGCAAPQTLTPSAALPSLPLAFELVAYDDRLAIFVGLTISPEIAPPIA